MDEDFLVDGSEESSELFEHHRFIVDKGQALLRIDKFITDKLAGVSRTRIRYASDAGNILVNNIAVKQNYKVKPLDVISIVLPFPPIEIELIPQNIPIQIFYEDEHLIVINKEAGLVVHPGKGNYSGTLINALLYHFKDLPKFMNGEMRPGLVHRIDKNTSGLLVVAKSEEALNGLAKQFFDHTTERTYNAIVWGTFTEKKGTVTANIGRSTKDRTKQEVFPDASQGKHAVTHYTVLRDYGFLSLIECKLETGRTHQIRAHMQFIGHPLFNDPSYGGNTIVKGSRHSKYEPFIKNCFDVCPRHALHAKTLGFIHPINHEQVQFNTELPGDMQQLIDKIERYIKDKDA